MAHVRKQIRDALAAKLTSDVALVRRNVFSTRVFPLDGGKLPCISVYTSSEGSELLTMGAKTLRRGVSVVVEAYIRATGVFDDDADAIAVQVEAAVASDTTLGGVAKDTVLTSTEIEFSGDAEQPIGVARLTFDVLYVTSIDDASQAR